MMEARATDRNKEITSIRRIIKTIDLDYFHCYQGLSNWLEKNGVEVINEL